MILLLEDKYGPLLSIHIKKVPITFIWRHNDVLMTSEPKNHGFYTVFFTENADFQIFTKNHRNTRFWCVYQLIMKESEIITDTLSFKCIAPIFCFN